MVGFGVKHGNLILLGIALIPICSYMLMMELLPNLILMDGVEAHFLLIVTLGEQIAPATGSRTENHFIMAQIRLTIFHFIKSS